MRQLMLLASIMIAFVPIHAEKKAKMEDWQDPGHFEENRMPMAATFVTDQQQTISLNGVWKFNLNETIEGRTQDFETVAFDDSAWGTIPVPGMWEMNGYGDPVYLNAGYPWKGNYENNPPYVPTERNYVGQYRRYFDVEQNWKGKQICLCIGAATSNVRVWVNGKMVGYSQDSKLEARFDITDFIEPGQNVIALEIFRWCDGTYLEDQDFWRFAGISRGVYVYTREKERIENVRVVADMDGKFVATADVTSGIKNVKFNVLDKSGAVVSTATVSPEKKIAQASGTVSNPALWSAESPSLYTLEVVASNRTGISESTKIQFGFRTVEIKNSQLFVNGQPVLIKGADRHEMNADKGYVVSEADMIQDIKIMKELNMNAVRTCHYPDDPIWYALCDKYGIYVVDEGNIESHGMGYGDKTLANRDDFKAAHLERDSRMVKRDINHPSVIIWSLGNEAGNGKNFYACYDWIKAYDSTRPVQYERAGSERNTDIICPMYWSPEYCESFLKKGTDRPLIQCEYAHAMGNSMGNFKEYWDLIRKYPSYQGGFIWDFVDQAVSWPSEEGGTDHIFVYGGDFNDYDPSDGPFNCNGVIAADRSLHPHAYEVRYQYRNILTTSDDPKSGVIKIYNENFFKDLSQYRLVWNLEVEGDAVLSGVVENLDVKPQTTATVKLNIGNLPQTDKDVYLNLSYVLKAADGLLPAGAEVAYDQILVKSATSKVFALGSAACTDEVSAEEVDGNYVFYGQFIYNGKPAVNVSNWEVLFDGKTGFLSSYKINGREILSEPLMPEFSRAMTENDLGAGSHSTMNAWRYQSFKLKTITINAMEDFYRVSAEYEPIANGAAKVFMTYDLYPDGSIAGTESMKDAGNLAKAPNLFRFGMKFTMPGDFSTIVFFGKGPWENYCDRNSSAIVGRYVQTVNEQFHYGYVRPQESGTKTELRFWRVLDSNGTGLEISAANKFSASALPFSIAEMDCANPDLAYKPRYNEAIHGAPLHSLNLKSLAHENDRANGSTFVNFDMLQQGVAGNDSWHALPLEQYRIKAQEREFHFVIRPVNN